jgi:hypothetical protein
MCRRVGNAFLLSATVDDIGNGWSAPESVRGASWPPVPNRVFILVRLTSGLE